MSTVEGWHFSALVTMLLHVTETATNYVFVLSLLKVPYEVVLVYHYTGPSTDLYSLQNIIMF